MSIKFYASTLLCFQIILLNELIECQATRCFLCAFHLGACNSPLDCYNQPDICSNINFSPLQSPLVECEFGCEQYVITDATGSTVFWRRGCAGQGSPRSSHICFNRNLNFLRHEQCWCHQDYCNSSSILKSNKLLMFSSVMILFLVIFELLLRGNLNLVNAY